MNSPETPASFQSHCCHLRSKEMHYQGEQDDEFAGGSYWCALTQESFGPDNQTASKTECCAGRSCYVE